MKNYIGFVNDHSGSMASLAKAATTDYNANITAVKDAASREMLDTIVSVVGVGADTTGYGCVRQVIISNPHVLKPVTNWSTSGGTPLYDGVWNMIDLFKSLPDYNTKDVSFLVMTTTDGQEMHSKKNDPVELAREIAALQATGRWTFVFRVPEGKRRTLDKLKVPVDNIQEWGTTAEGMAKSTAATTKAMDTFYATRAAGKTSSTVFYADASAVDAKTLAATLKDISSEVSLYVVPDHESGIEIQPFILTKRMEYLKGAAFYQLTKTEARVQPTKLIVIRDKTTGKMYSGAEARKMLGLNTVGNIRLHPGDHGNYDLFIQSTSVNRKLVGGTGVLYWKAIGVPFKPEDTAYLNGPVAAPKPAVVVLPKVAPTNKPTPSPLKPTPKVAPFKFFATRTQARNSGKQVFDVAVTGIPSTGSNGCRWYVKN
jgi:hypothetical protein